MHSTLLVIKSKKKLSNASVCEKEGCILAPVQSLHSPYYYIAINVNSVVARKGGNKGCNKSVAKNVNILVSD